LSVNSSSDF